jgi:hypothetical protein
VIYDRWVSEGHPTEDWGARIPEPRVLRFGSGLGFLLLIALGAIAACVVAIVAGLALMDARNQSASPATAAPSASDDMIYLDLGPPSASSSATPP